MITETEYYDFSIEQKTKFVAYILLEIEPGDPLPDHRDANTVMAVIEKLSEEYNIDLGRDANGEWGMLFYENNPNYCEIGNASAQTYYHAVYLAAGRAKGVVV